MYRAIDASRLRLREQEREPLATLEGWLNSACNTLAPQRTERMLQLLCGFGTPHELAWLVRHVLQDPERLTAAARLSYTHYNGFDKLVLMSSRTLGYKLRMHVWWGKPAQQGIENIHNHRWDFCSVLVKGGYRAQEFRPGTGAGEEEFLEYQYFSPAGAKTYQVKRVGTARLDCTADYVVEAGEAYFLPHDVLHRVLESHGPTISLFMHGAPVRGHTNVFSRHPLDTPDALESAPLTPVALAERLEAALEVLSK